VIWFRLALWALAKIVIGWYRFLAVAWSFAILVMFMAVLWQVATGAW